MIFLIDANQGLICPAAAASEGVSPALLTRARSVAAEHGALSKQLAEGFDTRTAKKVGELSPVASALKEWEHANEVRDIPSRGLSQSDCHLTVSRRAEKSHRRLLYRR